MKARALGLAILLAVGSAPAVAAPANTLREMFSELRACLRPLRMAVGSDVTLQFSLDRRGSLMGKPRVTYARLPRDPDTRAETVKAIAKAFNHCLPLSITDALGGAVAGRPMAYRLKAPPPGQGL